MKGSIKIKSDTKALDSLLKNIMFAAENSAKVGHSDNDPHYSGMSMAELGLLLHEGGVAETGNIVPARPYLEDSAKMYQLYLKDRLEEGATKLLTNFSSKQELEALGKDFKNIVQSLVHGGLYTYKVPNAQFTIDEKNGADTPLVATSDFMDALKVEVSAK